MTVTYAPDVTDYFTTQLIRRTANALVETGIFPQSDLDDVIQELRLCLLTQVPNFDPSKARWSTFVKHVVRMSAISLRRRQNAECRRGSRQVGSLNVLVDGPFGAHTQLGAMVSEEEHCTGVGQGFISHPIKSISRKMCEQLSIRCQQRSSKSASGWCSRRQPK